jgi:phospholipase C
MAHPIRHLVVLMMENRSFDHMAGFMKAPGYPIDGLNGNESNPMSPQDPTPVVVSSDAPYVLPFDAGHSVPDTNVQLFLNIAGPPPVGPSNRGFVYNYSQQQNVTPATAPLVMKCFAPASLPVLTTLARQFALCDHWYSSVPGPTWPNRFFVHAATSKGFIDNSLLHNYDMRSIFENLSDAGLTWKIYSHDFPQSQALWHLQDPQYANNWDSIGGFKDDAAGDTLPHYSFIEPKYTTFFGEANDQHPPHDVRAGEQLIADVYNAVRNSPGWGDSLLIVLYDEHGGTYDHELPPPAVPPDNNTDQFAFNRLGLRVPAVLISPYVKAGRIVDRVFDHTSVPATIKKVFGLPAFLTNRDAQANTFEDLLDAPAARTDTPVNIAPPPALATAPGALGAPAAPGAPVAPVDIDEWGDQIASADAVRAQLASGKISSAPVSDLQASLVELARTLPTDPSDRVAQLDHARRITTEHDAAVYLRQAAERFRRYQRGASRR